MPHNLLYNTNMGHEETIKRCIQLINKLVIPISVTKITIITRRHEKTCEGGSACEGVK